MELSFTLDSFHHISVLCTQKPEKRSPFCFLAPDKAFFAYDIVSKNLLTDGIKPGRPRGRTKKTWTEIVQKDCQAHKFAVYRNRWRKQMIDDHNRCEWVNVSSGPSSPGLSQTKSGEL